MSNDLIYQMLVAVFSGAAGFAAGLGVSWKMRRGDDGEPVYTPTLNTGRGMRALFIVITILAVGSVILTAIINNRNKIVVQRQTDCNRALTTIVLANAAVNRSDAISNAIMVRQVATLYATPAEDRNPQAFRDALAEFLARYDANTTTRDSIPLSIPGCEKELG
jgi:hypothetical protein